MERDKIVETNGKVKESEPRLTGEKDAVRAVSILLKKTYRTASLFRGKNRIAPPERYRCKWWEVDV